MNRRRLALIAVAAAGLVIAPLVLVAVTRPVDTPSPVASSTRSPSTSPSSDATPFVDAETPEEAAWYRIGTDPRVFPRVIQVGTMSQGVTAEIPIPAAAEPRDDAILPGDVRPAVGVGGGVVVLLKDDGRSSALSAVVAQTGEVNELLQSDDVILEAVMDDVRREVFFITADRLTGDLVGAWRFSLETLEAPRPIESLVGSAPEVRPVAVTTFATALMLSADGSTIALWRCVELDCLLRAVRIDEGALVGQHQLDRGFRDPVAITERVALLVPVVPDGPERFAELLDLATGERVPLRVEQWPFNSHALDGDERGAFLAIQSAGSSVPPELIGQPAGNPPEVTVISLNDLELRATISPPLSSLRVVDEDGFSEGVDLPPGWLLVQGSEPDGQVMGFYALHVDDGRLVPLPALGEILVQG